MASNRFAAPTGSRIFCAECIIGAVVEEEEEESGGEEGGEEGGEGKLTGAKTSWRLLTTSLRRYSRALRVAMGEYVPPPGWC